MKLFFTMKAKKQIRALDEKTKKRIETVLDNFVSGVRNIDRIKLKGESDKWRIRVGIWRIILKIDTKNKIARVLQIKRRPSAY